MKKAVFALALAIVVPLSSSAEALGRQGGDVFGLDMDGFARWGGIIGMVVRDNGIRIVTYLATARRADIAVRSRPPSRAEIVER
jgi:hypothetical protein